MPIHLVLAVLYLRSSLDTEGPAGMRGASRGGKDVGTRAIETRRRSKQRRQEAQPYDEATRTCYVMHGRGTRSPAEKEVRDNSRTGGPAPPPRAVRGACPTAKDLLDLHVHRLQKKTARGSDSEAKATANLMVAQQLSWILSSKKTRPGSRRRARRVVRGEGGEGGAKSGVFYF